jgi:hypothetical protein
MTRKLIYLILALLMAVVTGARCFAQEPAKTLQWSTRAGINDAGFLVPPDWVKRVDQLELEDILLGEQSIVMGGPFVGDIRALRFRLKNVSDKPINFAQITLLLPELKHSPPIPFLRTEGDPVPPDGQFDLRIPAKMHQWVADYVTKNGKELRGLTKAAIYMVQVGSINGEGARGGCMKTRDSRNECSAR